MSEINYRQKIAIQDAILGYAQQLITNNGVSPVIVEEALNKVIVQLYPLIIQEILIEEDSKHEEEIQNLMHRHSEKQNQPIPEDQEEVSDA